MLCVVKGSLFVLSYGILSATHKKGHILGGLDIDRADMYRSEYLDIRYWCPQHPPIQSFYLFVFYGVFTLV